MMNIFFKRIFAVSAILTTSLGVFAQTYVTVARQGNVYDEASAKYITLNQNNDEVSVIPGMVFATDQHIPGWYKIEYSPGLHAFIPEQIVASDFKSLSPGTYELVNNPGKKINIKNSGEIWTVSIDGKDYPGTKWEEILIFEDSSKNIIFSLVDIGNGPIAITYENSVTKFF